MATKVAPKLQTKLPHALLAEAMLHVAHNATRFVEAGLVDLMGQSSSLDMLELVLHHKLSDAAMGGPQVNRTAQPARTAQTWHAAVEESLSVFLAKCNDGIKKSFPGVPSPLIGVNLPDGIEEKVAKGFSAMAFLSPPSANKLETAPIEFAYDMAKFNLKRNAQRVVVLQELAAMVRVSFGNGYRYKSLQTELDTAYAKLNEAGIRHRDQAFHMAMLLGGRAQEECVADVKRMYGEGMVVSHLLSIEGAVPGYERSETSTKLRKAIAQATPASCATDKA